MLCNVSSQVVVGWLVDTVLAYGFEVAVYFERIVECALLMFCVTGVLVFIG